MEGFEETPAAPEPTPIAPLLRPFCAARQEALATIHPELLPPNVQGILRRRSQPTTVAEVLSILANPNSADAIVRSEPAGVPWGDLVAQAAVDVQSPFLLPGDIASEADFMAATNAVPIRPGAMTPEMDKRTRELIRMLFSVTGQARVALPPALIAQIARVHFGAELTGLHPDTIEALTGAASAGLRMAGDDETHKQSVLRSITMCIKRLSPWWVLGAGEIEPATGRLLALLAREAPREARRAAIMLLGEKLRQDGAIAEKLLYADNPDLQMRSATCLEPVLDALIDAAVTDAPDEAESAAATLLAQGQLAAQFVAERIMSHPALAAWAPVAVQPDGSFRSFGKTFRFRDSLPEQTNVYRVTYGIHAAIGQDGSLLGIADTAPERYAGPDGAIELPLQQLASVFPGKRLPEGMTLEALSAFFAQLPEMKARIRRACGGRALDMLTPLPAIVYLWQYEQTHPGRTNAIERFIGAFGLRGLTTFFTGWYSPQAFEDILTFALSDEANPKTRGGDRASVVLTLGEPSFTQRVFAQAADLAVSADQTARAITQDPAKQDLLRDTLLLRAKAMLAAVAKLHAARALAAHEQAYVLDAFAMYQLVLASLRDPAIAETGLPRIPIQTVRDFFRYHTDDPDSRALFYPILELWFRAWAQAQKTAPYYGRVDELNTAFYREYEAWMNAESGRTTGATELELVRYTTSIDHDIAAGRMPTEARPDGKPFAIAFAGIGTGQRMEAPIVRYIREKTGNAGIRFFGIDPRPDIQGLPEGIKLLRCDMAELGALHPDAFDMILSIWSPVMDVVELPQRIAVVDSLVRALKKHPHATIMVDVALPVDPSFYLDAVPAYHRAHPDEPEGVVERSYARGGALPPLLKLLFAAPAEELIGLMSQHGMTCTNASPDPHDLIALCEAIRRTKDVSPVTRGPQGDIDQGPWYMTPSGTLRVTLKFVYQGDGQLPTMELLAKSANAR